MCKCRDEIESSKHNKEEGKRQENDDFSHQIEIVFTMLIIFRRISGFVPQNKQESNMVHGIFFTCWANAGFSAFSRHSPSC
ncbi:hypothetical protein Ngar_c02850 [Candidatus Nitrososphaera gargensis Ga9.2]|uniref:Uncharacterized protein n=1 Tax=Nitrososphaera gargensis (strain Ga9.2) TaxID=1237085 RepID=K0IEM8_NITGG|nr:hypothetical protein Ngar_c02850 [Candidatus Nitrososphaera gargensis Ga9.2]